MKKKIVCILLGTLLIAATVLPVAGIMNDNKAFREASAYDSDSVPQTVGCIMTDWLEQAKLLASDGSVDDFFGDSDSVSIDGDYAIVGAWGDDNENGNNAGSAYIFKRTVTTWVQEAKLLASDGVATDRFGWSASIDGDYAIVGAYADDNHKGSAYVFKRTGATWTEEQKLTASDGVDHDYFARSVSIDGDYAIIGAYGDDNENGDNAGSAYIFKRTGASWSEEAKLLASDGVGYDEFAWVVSIDGSYAIIGAHKDDDNGDMSGSAYIFKRDGSSWTEEDKLIASDGHDDDHFGISVSISGDYVIIGAHVDDNKGSAYVFKRTGASWSEEAKLLASDGAAGDYFGWSASIDGDYAIIGAYGDDNENGDNAGSAYIFKRTGASWSEEDKLIASDGAAGDYFGVSVSISGDYAIAGAPADDNENGDNAGSAYVFKGEKECCLTIESMEGGLFATTASLKITAIIKNTGTAECKDVTWSFATTGGIVLWGPNSGTEPSILPNGTITVTSRIFIGLAIPGIFPGNVTITADASNNACPVATMEKGLFLFFLLLALA